MKHTISAAGAILATTLLLSACGGGGGGGTTVSANSGSGVSGSSGSIGNGNGSGDGGTTLLGSAEGIYEGSISNGRSTLTLILENDQYYSLYGRTVAGNFLVEGLIQGTGKSSNGSFSSSDLKDFYISDAPVDGTLTASYTPAVRFAGSSTEGNTTVTFTSQALSLNNYRYNMAPTMGNIAGNWTLTTLNGTPVNLTVQSNGLFSATSSGCVYGGTFTPRSSGKNVFDVKLSYGPAPCPLAGQSASGIAVEFIVNNNKRQLIVATLNPDRSNAAVLIGQR